MPVQEGICVVLNDFLFLLFSWPSSEVMLAISKWTDSFNFYFHIEYMEGWTQNYNQKK